MVGCKLVFIVFSNRCYWPASGLEKKQWRDVVAKFVFSEGYLGIQIDGTTGEVLSLEKRNADLIENIHDGSIVDKYLGWKSGIFKLLFTSVAGLALLGFTITGFWLWYGPKLMKK